MKKAKKFYLKFNLKHYIQMITMEKISYKNEIICISHHITKIFFNKNTKDLKINRI